jgi:hypothetical protein
LSTSLLSTRRSHSIDGCTLMTLTAPFRLSFTSEKIVMG